MLGLGARATRRPAAVLAVFGILVAVAGVFGFGVVDHLSTGGFEDPSSESTRAAARIEELFGQADPDALLVVRSRTGSVDDRRVAARGRELTRELAAMEGVDRVVSYWSLGGAPPLRSRDGSQALILANLAGDQNAQHRTLEVLAPRFTLSDHLVQVEVGGFSEVFRQVTTQVERDLIRAEAIAIPILLVMLLFVFRSLVAALLPLAVGLVSVVGTLLVLRSVAAVTEVSIFALNLTTAMGLGLGIDYSLFIVSRFREELAAGHATRDAVLRTVETAGRTVLFSAVAVAASLSALLLFPLAFLRSFAYAGIPVVILSAAGATIALPAVLALLGYRIDRFSVRRRAPRPLAEGPWYRIATAVMRRPVPVATAVVGLLLLLGAPFLGVELGLPDDRVLPPGAPGRVVHDRLRMSFAGNEAFAISVLAEGVDPAERSDDVHAYARRLSRMDEVSRVDAATGSYVDGSRLFHDERLAGRFVADDATFVSIVLDASVEPQSAEAEDVVKRIREMSAPFRVQVAGGSAAVVDGKQAVLSRFPLAAAWIGGVTLVALFLLFGSVLVPIKAVVLNLLSLTATFGAMVWIFQQGHFAGALDITPTGSLVVANIILMFCIAFGLSMDYEVFLLSRVKEEHDLSGDNEEAVARGLARTGRIVTAAAALIAVVFVAVATSGVSFVKMFGLGLALAVVMDATLVRAALVPAFMKLMGKANWWAPAPLRRFHDRFGFRDHYIPVRSER